jgi:hypothetical protein
MNKGFAIVPLLLAVLLLSSCDGFDLVGKTSLLGQGSAEEGKKFLVEGLNYWVGKSKDERMRVFGAPHKCTRVNPAGETCEWRNSKQLVAFHYDQGGVARSWSYRGEYGQFTNATHQMVKGTAIATNQPARKRQKETEWIHPTKVQKDLDQDYYQCRDVIEKDPKLAASSLGLRSGREYVSDESLEKCLAQKGWTKK